MENSLDLATDSERRGRQVNYVCTPAGFDVNFYARGITGTETLIQVCADLDSPDTLRVKSARCKTDAAQA